MKRKFAYIVSRFPKISETFILDEILDLERRGLEIEIFSLVEERESKMHPQVRNLAGQVHYAHWKQRAFWAAQFYWLSRHPSVYVRSWWKAVCGNLSSLKFFLRALFIVPAAAYFALLMKQHSITHIHAHWATHPALTAYVIQMLSGIRYSITAHAHDLYVNRTMLKEKLSSADFVVTISDYNKQLLGGYGPDIANKTYVIHCGVNPDLFPARVKRQEAASPFTILCVASLSDYKGHVYLIEACATLSRNGVNFRCLFAGEGPERAKLERRVAKLGLQNNVKLLGWQTRQEILQLMQHCDVFVLPSIVTKNGKQEGIPVALMEAMVMEIPVVATSISGIPELVEHGKNGLLVQQQNAAALAAAIYLIYKQPDTAREMALAGKSKVLNDFNLHINCGRLYRILSGHLQPDSAEVLRFDADDWLKPRERAC